MPAAVPTSAPVAPSALAARGRETDRVLVDRARQGDRAAFDTLVRRHRPAVWAYATNILGDPHLAEDVAQDTFLRAWRAIGRFDLDRRLWPWLQAIAHRRCLDEMRRRSRFDRRHVAIDETVPVPDHAAAAAAGVDRRRALSSALASLSPRHRALFLEQAIDGKTHEELARADGSSPGAVAKALVRARARIKGRLEPFGDLLAALPPFVFLGRSKGRVRDAVARHGLVFGPRVEVVAEGAMGLFVALAVVGTMALGQAVSPSDARRGLGGDAAVPAEVARAAGDVGERGRPKADAREREREHPERASRVGVESDLARGYAEIMSPREGGAAPREERHGVEIRDPAGNVLFWYEGERHCSRRGGSHLSQGMPIRFVC